MRNLISNLIQKVSTIVLTFLIANLIKKGDVEMMAMLFACRVVEGKTTFDKVPNKLKQQVADILLNDFGLDELVPDEYKQTEAGSDSSDTATTN